MIPSLSRIGRRLAPLFAAMALSSLPALAQETSSGPLRIEITKGVVEPMPIALPAYLAGDPRSADYAARITEVVEADLVRSGLFRPIQQDAHLGRVTDFNAPPNFPDWRAINAQALVTGQATVEADGRLLVQFRLWDVFAQEQIAGFKYRTDPESWRRVSHKVADAIYSSLTGEDGYFDSRIVFVDETGTKGDRRKRLAIMDQDGANLRYLTSGADLVLTPRFSPTDQEIIYISYAQGEPQVYLFNIETGQREALGKFPGMTFAPRFSPDGRQVVMSLSQGGATDIYAMDLATRRMRRLTNTPAIDTSPSFSPDGRQIVFESDRGGAQQLYIMDAGGGAAKRISFGDGRYGTPVWSPRGDIVAFTKIMRGRFQIGVMRVDGSNERILAESFLDEGPTWAPNGRVLMFFRETPGVNGGPRLYSVDLTGQNLRAAPTPSFASDPAWSPLLP
jgi:TolB protein